MRITISVNGSIIMLSGQQPHLSTAHFFVLHSVCLWKVRPLFYQTTMICHFL